MALSTFETALHRRGTEHFIEADPTEIVLIPRTEQIVDGTKRFVSQSPRLAQFFKVIWPGENGILRDVGPDGGVRRFDFILVGQWYAEVEIGDSWELGTQVFHVEYRYPDNEYEVKVGGVSHGSKPTGI
jgi:hypothetical protein